MRRHISSLAVAGFIAAAAPGALAANVTITGNTAQGVVGCPGGDYIRCDSVDGASPAKITCQAKAGSASLSCTTTSPSMVATASTLVAGGQLRFRVGSNGMCSGVTDLTPQIMAIPVDDFRNTGDQEIVTLATGRDAMVETLIDAQDRVEVLSTSVNATGNHPDAVAQLKAAHAASRAKLLEKLVGVSDATQAKVIAALVSANRAARANMVEQLATADAIHKAILQKIIAATDTSTADMVVTLAEGSPADRANILKKVVGSINSSVQPYGAGDVVTLVTSEATPATRGDVVEVLVAANDAARADMIEHLDTSPPTDESNLVETLADADDSARTAILQALIDAERPSVQLMQLETLQLKGPVVTLLQLDEDLDQQPVAELLPFDDPTPTLAQFDDTKNMVQATLIPFDAGTDDVQATLLPLDTVLGCESVPASDLTVMLLPLDDSIDTSTVSLLAVSRDISAHRARLAPLGLGAKSLDVTLTPLGFLHVAFAGWASYGRALGSSLVALDQAAVRAQGAIADLAVQSSVVHLTLAGLNSPLVTRPVMLKTVRSTLPGQLAEWRRRATLVSSAMQTLTKMRNTTATTWLEF